MSKDKVKLLAVEADTDITKKDGGTYRGAKLTYEIFGRVESRGLAAAYLANNAKLLAKIKSLEGQSGKEVTLHREKKVVNGTTYNNILDILPASEAEAYSGGGNSKPFNNRGGNSNVSNTKDVARIVRAVAIGAAAKVGGSADDVLANAHKFADFVIAPLGVDSMGVEFKKEVKEEVVVAEKSNDDFPL